jgi:hypothetical protein
MSNPLILSTLINQYLKQVLQIPLKDKRGLTDLSRPKRGEHRIA